MTAAQPDTNRPSPLSVMVTGGNGFVGRQVVRALLDSGIHTSIVCRSCASATPPDSRLHSVHATQNLFTETPERLTKLLTGFDTLIHCAWCTDQPDYLSSPLNMECLEGTLRLASAFTASGGKRFVWVGTCAEYAASLSPLTVSAPLSPTTLYGSCKAAAFLVLQNLLATTATSFAWCRLFYLYGEGEHSNRLTPTVRQHLENELPIPLTDGTQIRDFLDVRDAGRMIATCAIANVTGAINVCSGTGITVRAYVERLADDFGRHDLLQFGIRPANAFDPPVVIGIRDKAIFPR